MVMDMSHLMIFFMQLSVEMKRKLTKRHKYLTHCQHQSLSQDDICCLNSTRFSRERNIFFLRLNKQKINKITTKFILCVHLVIIKIIVDTLHN